jgi:hypothetical protein
MREIVVTAASKGDSPAVVLDQYQNPFSVTYSKSGAGFVQVTVTEPYPVVNGNFTEANFAWVNADENYPNGAGFLGKPYTAIRLYDANPGDTLTVIQSGVKG